MPDHSRVSMDGFTLIELITVMVIAGTISVLIISKTINITVFSVQSSRDEIVAALFLAQQTAMARDSSTNPIEFVATLTSINVRENGVSIPVPGVSYPLILPGGVTITAGTGTLDYDKLGRVVDGAGNPIPTPAMITLSGNGASATVVVSAGGYAD